MYILNCIPHNLINIMQTVTVLITSHYCKKKTFTSVYKNLCTCKLRMHCEIVLITMSCDVNFVVYHNENLQKNYMYKSSR